VSTVSSALGRQRGCFPLRRSATSSRSENCDSTSGVRSDPGPEEPRYTDEVARKDFNFATSVMVLMIVAAIVTAIIAEPGVGAATCRRRTVTRPPPRFVAPLRTRWR
jgi:hypothetical protein